MKGYVRRRGDRYYAVIYEGRDPVTGRERRTWHPAGTDEAEAERLAKMLAAAEAEKIGAVRALTFGAYLTGQWLPGKKLHLAATTYRGYERNVQLHILPALGKVAIRRLRYQQIEALYERLLHPVTGRALAPKTVYEIHLIISGALTDAVRRGLVTRNVAVVARAPKQRSLQRNVGVSLTEDELRLLMRTAAGHRLFPLYWLAAMTGMRRNDTIGYARTRAGNEIDLLPVPISSAAGAARTVPIEGKWVDDQWRSDARTIQAKYGNGILATKSIHHTDHPTWAIPAPPLALMLL